MAWNTFGRQHNVMKNNLPVLTYGLEQRSLTKALEQRHQSAQRGMEKVNLA